MIDSHLHLDAKNYAEEGGVGEILQRARAVGVHRMVTPSLHLASFANLCELAAQHHATIFPAAGVHPHEVSAEHLLNLKAKLEAALERLDVPILGETGLEGHYDFTSKQLQLDALAIHLEVARQREVPCIFHCRSAEQALHRELKAAQLPHPSVVHCFTGSWEWAKRFLDLGCYIGITGIVTFKKAGDVAEVASKLPLDRLLVETDGPYLAPIPHRGRTNKPEYIPLIVEAIARLRGVSTQEIAEATTRNTEQLFGLPQHSR